MIQTILINKKRRISLKKWSKIIKKKNIVKYYWKN